MIRTYYLTQVNKLIVEQKRFRETDFILALKNPDGTNEHILEITYCYEPEYNFIASMRVSGDVIKEDVRVTISMCPGTIFKREKASAITPDMLNEQIKLWLVRLSNELSSIPIQREVAEQRERLENILEQLQDIPKEYFSKEEGERLKSKLEELEDRLTANLANTVEDQAQVQSKVEVIISDISLLKENVAILNKQGWAKSFVTRTFEWLKDPTNRKVLTSGAEVAKELLLEAGKHIPDGK
jgi:hypothetical protein